MLGPFATASRLTPIHQVSLAVLSRAACTSMSTTSPTTTTTRGRGDRHGPMEWPNKSVYSIPMSESLLNLPKLLCTGELLHDHKADKSQCQSRAEPLAGLPSDAVPGGDMGHLLQRVLSDSTRHTVTDAELREALENRWVPTKPSDFPVSYHRKNGKLRARSLGPQHLKQFDWLAVSRVEGVNGAWCTFCALFKTSKEGGGRVGMHGVGGNVTMGRLVNQPLRDFSDLTGRNGCLSRHGLTEFHKANAVRVAEFVNRSQSQSKPTDVRTVISKARQQEIARNRSALNSVIETVKLCALQNIALRGHRDDGPIDPSGDIPVSNDGNFRALLRFRINAGDVAFQEHLHKTAKNATYVSKTIQNELLSDMCCMIKERIAHDVGSCGFWSVLADETTDAAKREQLVICLRFVSKVNDSYVVREEPIALVDLIGELKAGLEIEQDSTAGTVREIPLNASNVAKTIINTLHCLKVDFDKLVGQGYDGASTMSGQQAGVAAIVRERLAPLADYYHCAMHALNLSCSRAVTVTAIRHAQDIVTETTSFFGGSAKRNDHFMTTVQTHAPVGSQSRLVALCTTRFVERHSAIIAFWSLLPYIEMSLSTMTSWQSQKSGAQALTLLNSILQLEFIVGLICLREVSALLQPVSLSLQAVGTDLVEALNSIDATLSVLKQWRCQCTTVFGKLFREVTAMASDLDIQVTKPRTAKRSVYRCSAACDSTGGVEDYYRINVFNPMLDQVIADLSHRFADHQRQSLLLTHLMPHSAPKVSWDQVKPAVDKFSVYLTPCDHELRHEFGLWQEYCTQMVSEVPQTLSAVSALNLCPSSVYPNVHKLLQILATLPVSTAEPERMFSKVDLALTDIRSTMSEDRLEALILMQAHRRRVIDFTNADIINKFAASGSRKLSFSFPL